jgi:hypothetical protein
MTQRTLLMLSVVGLTASRRIGAAGSVMDIFVRLTERREAGGCQEPRPDILRSTGFLSVAVPLYISTRAANVTEFEARALSSPSATVALGGLLQNLNWVRPPRNANIHSVSL